jgi:murein tripeptide amidase MpaA
MTNSIVSQELDRDDAIPHFSAVVNADGRDLFSLASQYVGGGHFFALVPKGTPYDRVKQLKLGGLISLPRQEEKSMRLIPVRNLSECFTKEVYETAKSFAGATAFIREPYLEPGDKSDLLSGLALINEALFKVINLKECTSSELESSIQRYQVSWSFLLLISDVDQYETNIISILSRAICIAVNAYDGESYLYWIPEPMLPR